MDDKEVGKYWDENAENWIKLARLGYDRCRDLINSPAFFKMLPDIKNLKGLDIGCGEGYNTRIAAKKGAKLTALDISKVFIDSAKEIERQESLGIEYHVASAIDLPFSNDFFDFAIVNGTISQVRSKPLKVGQLKFLIRVQNSLKQGGKLFLAVKNNLSPQCFFRSLWPFHVDHNIYSYSGYRYLLKQAGFTNIKTYFVFPDYQFPSKILPSDKVLEFSYVPVYSRQYKRSLIKKAIIKIRTRLDLLIFKNFKLFQFSPSFIFVAESSR